MPLAMQGDKLFPRHENGVGGGASRGGPDRGCRDRLLQASGNLGQPPSAELGHHALCVGCTAMGENVDKSSLYLCCPGMSQLDCGEFLQMVMQEPGVIEDGLENKPFAAGGRSTMATGDRGSCARCPRPGARL